MTNPSPATTETPPVVVETVVRLFPPRLSLYMMCVKNDCPLPGDGGQLVFQVCAGQTVENRKNILGGNLVLVAANDAVMEAYPYASRDEYETRFFRVDLVEVSPSEVPPDPDAPPELFNKAGQRVNAHGDLVG